MDLLDDPEPGQNTPEYTVSEISGAVKRRPLRAAASSLTAP